MSEKGKLTVQQVAEIFEVDEQTIRRWIKEGKTFKVVFKLPGGYKIPAQEVERVWEAKKFKGES